MSLDRLAAVELQLVMHHCDPQTLLALTRCSRHTLVASSHPFAWRYCPPLPIDLCRCASAMADPPHSESAIIGQSVGRRFCCSFCRRGSVGPQPSPSPLPLPPLLRLGVAPNLPQPLWLGRVDQLVRWSGAPQTVGDWMHLDVARRLLLSLPRLVALDVPDWRISAVVWPHIQPLLLTLTFLTALDVSAGYLRAEHIHTLVHHLKRLRTLRCRPAGDARACLQPLTSLPHLTDLGLVALSLSGPPEDFNVVAGCRSLRRLALSDQFDGCCSSLLLAPGLRPLQELTLTRLHWLVDWAAVFANLPCLRRLSLDRCGRVGSMLAAVGRSCPQLRLLRLAPHILTHTNSWMGAFSVDPARVLMLGAVSNLLQRRPDIRIELRIGFKMAGVSASWLLPLRSECDWLAAVPRWTDFQLLYPRRHQFRDRPLLFPDSELGREETPPAAAFGEAGLS